MEDLNSIIDGVELENAVIIDIGEVDKRGADGASDFVNKICGAFGDDDFFDKHPRIKKRVSIEIETLRGLIKMRCASEQAHDALLNAISSNNSNTAFYRALSDTQRSSLAITTKIEECISRIEDLIKPKDEHINENNEDERTDESDNIHRGSKDFIKATLDYEGAPATN